MIYQQMFADFQWKHSCLIALSYFSLILISESKISLQNP